MPIQRARELLNATDSTLEQFLDITRALAREYGYICAIASYGLRYDDESFEAERELLTIVLLQTQIELRIKKLLTPKKICLIKQSAKKFLITAKLKNIR